MSKNTIISMAMIQALWNSRHQDLIDLIAPFVLYGVECKTDLNKKIDIYAVKDVMEKEFGYKEFPVAVIRRALQREYTRKQKESYIGKIKNNFYLVRDISDNNAEFVSKRTVCKEHVGEVVENIRSYFNERKVNKRDDYTAEEIENYILNFIESQGGAIVNSIDDLRRILSKKNEINYCLARFILQEHEKKSALNDYIEEMVKGYFVTAALYIQPENNNITTASFKDVTFYIDTRLLLAFLGYKSSQENESVQKMLKSLRDSGAKMACFQYNIDEIKSILSAYRQSITSNFKMCSNVTLEYFDELGYKSSHVDIALRNYEKRLTTEGIDIVDVSDITSGDINNMEYNWYLNEEKLKEKVREFKSSYNMSTLPDDIGAINAVSRIRKEKTQQYIERCKAVFVTTNIILVWAVKDYFKSERIEVGFPLAITGDDLCVLAWLKDFTQSNSLPQMRFMENVMASLKPNKPLMEKYFEILDELEKNHEISEEYSMLLRIDTFAKKELMEQTNGEKENVDEELVMHLRERVAEQSYKSGFEKGQRQSEEESRKRKDEKINEVLKKREENLNHKYHRKLKKWTIIVRIMLFVASFLFAAGTFVGGVAHKSILAGSLGVIVTVITLIQAIDSLIGSKKRILKFIEKKLNKKEERELDKIRCKILDFSREL